MDDAFFARRIGRAVELRRGWLGLDAVADAYRLVHSEGDGLSGLVVDRFGSVLVLEFFSAGMYRFRNAIQAALSSHYPDARFYWFAEEHVQKQESFDCRAPEPPPPEVITEHGVRFRVAPGSKHKTGFFLDQRDNRKTLASFCAGRRVLDLCCNTGGFAVYAKALGGADEVVGVDLDEQALALARQNAGLNQVRVRFVQADLFPWLREIDGRGTALRRGRARPRQADARPGGGGLRPEALPRHEPAGAAGRGAGRDLPDLFLHRPGRRGSRSSTRSAGRRGRPGASSRCCAWPGPAPTIRSLRMFRRAVISKRSSAAWNDPVRPPFPTFPSAPPRRAAPVPTPFPGVTVLSQTPPLPIKSAPAPDDGPSRGAADPTLRGGR